VARIALLVANDVVEAAPYVASLKDALSSLGWIEGKNIAIEYRYADGVMKRFPGIAAEVVFLKVDVIVEMGGLMSYGMNRVSQWRRAAYYVDRILRGAKPSDLPVEQPMMFELAVNRKAAGALGIALLPSILVRADRVIE
jgi:ABC transporter substrate binding protein